MKTVIWPPPLYSFLSYITMKVDDPALGKKILDCGAGGKYPPLILFTKHGFESYGIDISAKQIEEAKDFVADQGMELDIRESDMRNIPFPDEYFDFCYESFSMCHMVKGEIKQAIREMRRVLRKRGYLFLGFILQNTWPLAGRERVRGSGEYWCEAEGEEPVHSVFTEEETEEYLDELEIVKKEILTVSDISRVRNVTLDEWLRNWDTADDPEEEKRKRYEIRHRLVRYTHLFYILRKQA